MHDFKIKLFFSVLFKTKKQFIEMKKYQNADMHLKSQETHALNLYSRCIFISFYVKNVLSLHTG